MNNGVCPRYGMSSTIFEAHEPTDASNILQNTKL